MAMGRSSHRPRAAAATIALAAWAGGWPAVFGQEALEWSPGSSSIREKEEFPPAFRGKWAPNPEACDDLDGVEAMEIYADGIDTYESGGRLARITQSGQERTVIARLEFEGEGRFWDVTWTMGLRPDGQSLALSETEIVEDSMYYTKCPPRQE